MGQKVSISKTILISAPILFAGTMLLLTSRPFILDPDESLYLEMSCHAYNPSAFHMWNVRCFFYPLILATIKEILSFFSVLQPINVYHVLRASNFLISGTTFISVYIMARLTSGKAAGLAATGVLFGLSVWQTTIQHVMMEGPFIAMLTGSVALLMWGQNKQKLRPFFVSGLLTGMSIMTKYDGIIILPALIILLIYPRTHRGKRVLYFLSGLALAGALYCIIETIYWGYPFASAWNFFKVNFIEKIWTKWASVPVPVMQRLRDAGAMCGWSLLLPAAVGATLLIWKRNSRAVFLSGIVLYVAVFRLTMEYYLPRFWILIIPLMAVLAGTGWAEGFRAMARLFPSIRPRYFTCTGLILCWAIIIGRLPEIQRRLQHEFQDRKTAFATLSQMDGPAPTSRLKNPVYPSIATVGPFIMPRFFFTNHLYMHYYYLDNAEALKMHDQIFIPSEIWSRFKSRLSINEIETAELSPGLVFVRKKIVTTGRLLLACSASIFEYKSTGDPHQSGWALWENGKVCQRVNIPATGYYSLEIEAFGTPCNGVYPEMRLSMNRQIIYNWNVTSVHWQVYTWQGIIKSGVQNICIEYNNDALTSESDRDLFLRYVKIKASLYEP